MPQSNLHNFIRNFYIQLYGTPLTLIFVCVYNISIRTKNTFEKRRLKNYISTFYMSSCSRGWGMEKGNVYTYILAYVINSLTNNMKKRNNITFIKCDSFYVLYGFFFVLILSISEQEYFH